MNLFCLVVNVFSLCHQFCRFGNFPLENVELFIGEFGEICIFRFSARTPDVDKEEIELFFMHH